MCEKHVPILGNLIQEKHKETGHFPGPGLTAIPFPRFYRARQGHIFSCGKKVFVLFFLSSPSLLSGYDRHGNCAGLPGSFFLFPQTNPLSPWENRTLIVFIKYLPRFSIAGNVIQMGKSWRTNS